MIKILCSFIESFFVVLDSDLLYEKAPLNFVTTIFNLSYCPPPPTSYPKHPNPPPTKKQQPPPPHTSNSPPLRISAKALPCLISNCDLPPHFNTIFSHPHEIHPMWNNYNVVLSNKRITFHIYAIYHQELF